MNLYRYYQQGKRRLMYSGDWGDFAASCAKLMRAEFLSKLFQYLTM